MSLPARIRRSLRRPLILPLFLVFALVTGETYADPAPKGFSYKMFYWVGSNTYETFTSRSMDLVLRKAGKLAYEQTISQGYTPAGNAVCNTNSYRHYYLPISEDGNGHGIHCNVPIVPTPTFSGPTLHQFGWWLTSTDPNKEDCNEAVGNPCDPASGKKYEDTIDYQGGATRIQLSRHYRSDQDNSDTLGLNWTHTLERRLLIDSSGTISSAARGDGRVFSYYYSYSNGTWNPDSDISHRLSPTTDGYKLESRDGTFETYDSTGRLVSKNLFA